MLMVSAVGGLMVVLVRRVFVCLSLFVCVVCLRLCACLNVCVSMEKVTTVIVSSLASVYHCYCLCGKHDSIEFLILLSRLH